MPTSMVVIPKIEVFQDEPLQPAPFPFTLRLTVMLRLRSSSGGTVLLRTVVEDTLFCITLDNLLRIHTLRQRGKLLNELKDLALSALPRG